MNVFDVIIIGFGKGGKTLAAEFAKRGQKVAIIERSEKMYGGTCINIGCIPTKTLVHQAKIAWGRKETAFEEKSDFYRQAIAVKDLYKQSQCDCLYRYRLVCFFRYGRSPHGYGRNPADIQTNHYQYRSGNGHSTH